MTHPYTRIRDSITIVLVVSFLAVMALGLLSEGTIRWGCVVFAVLYLVRLLQSLVRPS